MSYQFPLAGRQQAGGLRCLTVDGSNIAYTQEGNVVRACRNDC